MEVLDRYFQALRAHDWDALADCLAEDVERTGPYRDMVRGREAYAAFLAEVLPTLENHRLEIRELRRISERSALVLLSEILDVNGRSTEFPEALLFDLDADGRIARVDIYLKQPPR